MEKWVEIRRKVLANEASKRAICQEYKIHWDTLQRILAYPEPPKYEQKRPRKKPKLGDFVPIIHEILKSDQQVHRKQRHTAKRITVVASVDEIRLVWADRLVARHLKALKMPTILAECEKVMGATLDRLTHRCHILEMHGDSYRLREARRRRGGKREEGLGGAQEEGEDDRG